VKIICQPSWRTADASSWSRRSSSRRDGRWRQRGQTPRFGVHVRTDNREGTPPLVRLKAAYGSGDQSEPVRTVQMADEDLR
jgi:hypothetical protein